VTQLKHTRNTGDQSENIKDNRQGVLVFQVHYEDYHGMSFAKVNYQRGRLDSTTLDSDAFFFSMKLDSSVEFFDNGPQFRPGNLTAYEVFGDPFDDSSEWRFIKDYEF
jgi:hypothetical protein